MIADELMILLGHIPKDKSEFTHRMRLHQGWWRMAVLAEEAGKHPLDAESQVCNTLPWKTAGRKNFLTESAYKAFELTKAEQPTRESGIIEEERLVTNLLSSQPLCFNFFGELKVDLEFACDVLKCWFPDVHKVTALHFEYGLQVSPFDKSAFDVALLFDSAQGRGLLGLECKYTDDFSGVASKPERYRAIYERSKEIFTKPFEVYQTRNCNQLFRNQLIVEEMKHRNEIDFGITGIFCHQDDEHALEAARGFQREMLTDGQERFRVLAYADYITAIQRLDISWDRREWLMVLWARYCGTKLSDCVDGKVRTR